MGREKKKKKTGVHSQIKEPLKVPDPPPIKVVHGIGGKRDRDGEREREKQTGRKPTR